MINWRDTGGICGRVGLCIGLSVFCFFTTAAQVAGPPSVTASFDRDSVVIGDRVTLEVRVDKDMMQMVDFPHFEGGEIVPEMEIAADLPVDTLSQSGRGQTIRKRYLLTVWSEGEYNIGRFPVLYADKNTIDTLYSRDTLRVRVATFDIDLEKDSPFDIKPPRGVSLKFGEIGGWFFLCLAVLAVVVAAGWLLTKYRHRIPLLGGARPTVPPHVEAIRRLEELRHQKLPQNGHHKQYYSGLVDILREYLSGRWGIGAMEMTSDEILAAVEEPRRAGEIDSKRHGNLVELLHRADLVKFAKFVPDESEGEGDWYNAYYFVEETKLVEVEGRAEETEDDI